MKKYIAIIEYGVGNVHSVENALTRLGYAVRVTSRARDIEEAHALILPGVGAFSEGMKNLTERGLIEVLREAVLVKKKPCLGICLGMQLLAEEGTEHGLFKGLGWIPGRVVRFERDEKKFPVPHIGWNDVAPLQSEGLFHGIKNKVFYFVHSYHFETKHRSDVLATCDYDGEFVAAVAKDNIFGVQFHPEKSQKSGLELLKNFLSLHA